MLRAVLFDVDFTLSRPGPELGPEAYRRVGAAHGLELDPGRYEEARLAAFEDLRTHPELVHDEEIWVAFTEDIVRGMGGDADGARACAAEIVRRWEIHANFDLYDDAVPALGALRGHGLRIGLISNGQRDLEEFARHHRLDVDVAVGSKSHGRTKPHASIFESALTALGVAPAETVMVGDFVPGRHRGRPRARYPRDPARPRRAVPGRARSHHRSARPPGRARSRPRAVEVRA